MCLQGYNSIKAAPDTNPAPKALKMIRSPGAKRPLRLHSSSSMGQLELDELPWLSMLTGNLSSGCLRKSLIAWMIRMLAWCNRMWSTSLAVRLFWSRISASISFVTTFLGSTLPVPEIFIKARKIWFVGGKSKRVWFMPNCRFGDYGRGPKGQFLRQCADRVGVGFRGSTIPKAQIVRPRDFCLGVLRRVKIFDFQISI